MSAQHAVRCKAPPIMEMGMLCTHLKAEQDALEEIGRSLDEGSAGVCRSPGRQAPTWAVGALGGCPKKSQFIS
jgi:hypothetical protein